IRQPTARDDRVRAGSPKPLARRTASLHLLDVVSIRSENLLKPETDAGFVLDEEHSLPGCRNDGLLAPCASRGAASLQFIYCILIHAADRRVEDLDGVRGGKLDPALAQELADLERAAGVGA